MSPWTFFRDSAPSLPYIGTNGSPYSTQEPGVWRWGRAPYTRIELFLKAAATHQNTLDLWEARQRAEEEALLALVARSGLTPGLVQDLLARGWTYTQSIDGPDQWTRDSHLSIPEEPQ